ncbi:chromosome segregation ATPase [Salinibacter ruber]|uniref:hypothetical protein n=1 Tax=Salinibacter ruber TaxID=146919 RepID=UPI00216728E9|nr:hypothetical protein [Salinibacter ruber]MCS4172066.1 chromosome segregation ATPase [Salinibacter ruber]
MGFFDSATETVEDFIRGNPTAELRDFFDTDFQALGVHDLDDLKDRKRRLESRRESEQKRADRPGRVKHPGEDAKRIAAEAERRIEWLDEKISEAEARIAEVEEERDRRQQKITDKKKQLHEEAPKAAQKALDLLSEVEEHVQEIRDLESEVEEARAQAALSHYSARMPTGKKASARLEKLRNTLESLTE